MDALTKVVVVTIIATLVTLGVVVVLTVNSINQANIPDNERGTLISKQAFSGAKADYSVTVKFDYGQTIRTLYLKNDTSQFNYIAGTNTTIFQDDAAFYQALIENKTYVFEGFLDFNNKMIFFQTVTEVNNTSASATG
jgi:hypothetical protein